MITVKKNSRPFVHPNQFVDGHAYFSPLVNQVLICNRYDKVTAFTIDGYTILTRATEEDSEAVVKSTWGEIYEVDLIVEVKNIE